MSWFLRLFTTCSCLSLFVCVCRLSFSLCVCDDIMLRILASLNWTNGSFDCSLATGFLSLCVWLIMLRISFWNGDTLVLWKKIVLVICVCVCVTVYWWHLEGPLKLVLVKWFLCLLLSCYCLYICVCVTDIMLWMSFVFGDTLGQDRIYII